jgi:predicted nucleic acid-binding protein
MIYADSSLVTAFYLYDTHSAEAIRRMASRPLIVLSTLNRAELANALYRQAFLGKVSASDAQFAWNNFESDLAVGVWQLNPFPNSAWDTCADLARRHGPTLGIRTLDSLHVACALELGARRFWTFDERQARLAQAAGLNTA